ncbi:hypothetical protein SAMN02745194_01579 [Roseomonas rosea]|uniref:Uncharacterized protein n=1 Tax=Muricoccus roseus TaxID=198092 RepID=A0A1M6FUU5_9PROT|nr:hypothetical protein [Roseomonas rosea]SHJ01465.1 hypothetical protein SAMN02745194_01579 [Roseomonas rosea]
MRRTLPAMLACLALAPLASGAQTPRPPQGQPQAQQGAPVLPRVVVGAPGRCELTVSGDPRPCTSGLVYVHHTNGSVLLSVQSGPGVTLGFQAENDRQPRPEDYTMQLSRLHTSINGQTAAKQVSGSCEIHMSTDGRTWHRATCRATDRSGLVTVMNFTGDGRQVTAAQPGQQQRGQQGQGNRPSGSPPATNAPATPPKS